MAKVKVLRMCLACGDIRRGRYLVLRDTERPMHTDFTPEHNLAELRDTLSTFDDFEHRSWAPKSTRFAACYETLQGVLAETADESRPVEERIDLAIAHLESIRTAYELYEPGDGEMAKRAVSVALIDISLEQYAGILPPDGDPFFEEKQESAPALR